MSAPPPAEEWFDVVDREDRVVGRAPRAEVHARGLLHRAVHLWVVNEAGQVFLQKRSRWKDSSPGLWDSSASGHLDVGEDYAAAVVREAYEELGLVLAQRPEELLRMAACEATGEEFVRVYHARAEGPFSLPPAEIERGEWFLPGEIDAWMDRAPDAFAPSFVHLWRLARESRGFPPGESLPGRAPQGS
jgi:isopentenyl-diphosphate delta-isomerase type 1